MSGDIVYFQLNVADGEKAQAFYGELFGWKTTPGNVPGGFNFEGTNPPGGGAGGVGEPKERPLVYFGVDDLKAGRAKVVELGGEAGEVQQAGPGTFAVCRDDQGVEFGLFAFA